MNCSADLTDYLVVGCRDRRIFVFDKHSAELERIKVIETPESVHCMTVIRDESLLVVGMTDANIMLLQCGQGQDFGIVNEGRFPELGGIWSLCGLNRDTELAVGTLKGIYIMKIATNPGDVDGISRPSTEHYLPD